MHDTTSSDSELIRECCSTTHSLQSRHSTPCSVLSACMHTNVPILFGIYACITMLYSQVSRLDVLAVVERTLSIVLVMGSALTGTRTVYVPEAYMRTYIDSEALPHTNRSILQAISDDIAACFGQSTTGSTMSPAGTQAKAIRLLSRRYGITHYSYNQCTVQTTPVC